jgi:undecaprenyl-diphosphatase
MEFWEALILGIIQGITEFLPISSTAHLILVPYLFGMDLNPETVFVFDILLQFGTVASVVVYFRRDLYQIVRSVIEGLIARQPLATAEARLGWQIVAGTVPAIVFGLALRDAVEGLHGQPIIVAVILMAAAGLIFAAERIGRRTRAMTEVTWTDAIVIGCFQALALLPGVSRSGATLCGALICGLERPAAARFSFLLMVPALLGASAVATRDLLEIPNFVQYLPVLGVGTMVSFAVGLVCIHWLLSYLARASLDIFGWYRLAFGAISLTVLFLTLR